MKALASRIVPPTWIQPRALPRIGMLIFSLLACQTGASAALNDNLVDSQLLDLGGRIAIETTGFGREAGEVGANNTNSRTAWFVWTAPSDTPQRVQFSSYGSSYDTVINVFKRDPAKPELLVTSLIPLAGAPENPTVVNDDSAINVTQGYASWTPVAGTTYYISVGRNSAGGGNTTLEATFGALIANDATVLIPNDNLAGALQFAATPSLPTQVQRGANIPGTTIGATTETGEQNLGPSTAPRGGTVWYRYTTGPVAEVFSVELNSLATDVGTDDVVLQTFENTVDPALPTFPQLTFVDEDTGSSLLGTPRVVINAAANTEYYFRVTSDDGDGTTFNIRLDFDPVAPANDAIATAIALTDPLPIVRNEGENIYSATTTDASGFDGSTSGNNVWFSWKATQSGLVRLRSIAPTPTATTGNFHPDGSTFLYDAAVFFDSANATDTVFDVNTRQQVATFNENQAQSLSFYAHKDVTYFIEIGGDNTDNDAGRGFFAFVLEDLHISDIARTGISFGSEGVLKTIMPPVVNITGDVGFQATLEFGGPVTNANDAALFVFNGSTEAAVVKGDQEFGTSLDIDGDGINDDRVTFSTFSNLFLADRNPSNNANPDLGFCATLGGKSDDEPLSTKNNKGFFVADIATGDATQLRLNDYLNNSSTWNDGAAFLFAFNTPVRETFDNTALVTGRMKGIPTVRDTGIFSTIPSVVIQEEDPAPNTADGIEFGDITGTPSVNGSNAMAFRAVLRGDGVTGANDTALYSVANYNSAPTALNYRLRLRKGSGLLVSDGTPLLGGATIFSISEPRVNVRGKIAVMAGLNPGSGSPAAAKTNDTVILSDLVTSDLTFGLVAREGDEARGANGEVLTGVRFASFVGPALITTNAVVFTAKVSGTGVTKNNDMGIWLWDGTTSYLIARKGDAVPGIVSAGVTFKTLGVPLANAAGRVAFTATIGGSGVTAASDTGLWTVSEDGLTPLLRLREGDVYDFGVVELPIRRTITAIGLTTGSGGDDGFARGMDQDGSVAVVVDLNKGKTKSGQAILKVAP